VIDIAEIERLANPADPEPLERMLLHAWISAKKDAWWVVVARIILTLLAQHRAALAVVEKAEALRAKITYLSEFVSMRGAVVTKGSRYTIDEITDDSVRALDAALAAFRAGEKGTGEST
jgi:hypothetical protein